jgi:hypothetical protein
MTFFETVNFYHDKKNAKSEEERMSKDEIRNELREIHAFSDEEIKLIFREISELELAQLNPIFSGSSARKERIGYSYFFFVLGLVAFGYSIYTLQKEPTNPLIQMLPYVMILGALFLMVKHGTRILNRNKK